MMSPADAAAPEAPLIEVVDLKVHFPLRKGLVFEREIGAVRAVDGVSFSIPRGRTLGLVGESGCGKSTVGRAILQLVQPTAGSIRFRGRDLAGMTGETLRRERRRFQLIFQDPYASLNPRMNVGDMLAEPLRLHELRVGASAVGDRVRELLALVGLPAASIGRYPNEFSGGQRQRLGIARALACEPDLIVCDEPVSALDMSIQAQIVNLLQDLQERLGLTYLFIAHGLNVIRHISHRVAVMYLGRIVEMADKEELYANPAHPYTRALLSAAPVPDPAIERRRRRIILKGDVPSPLSPPDGCRFHPRCPMAASRCATAEPPFAPVTATHVSACLRIDEIESAMPNWLDGRVSAPSAPPARA